MFAHRAEMPSTRLSYQIKKLSKLENQGYIQAFGFTHELAQETLPEKSHTPTIKI